MFRYLPLLIALALSPISKALDIRHEGPIQHERRDTPNKKNAHVGRYLYIGNVPKFAGNEIEITVSKMALTTRVMAWVNQERIDNFAETLFNRWQLIDSALKDPQFKIHPAMKLESLKNPRSSDMEAWIKVANQYSSHLLEGIESLYSSHRGADKLISSGEDEKYRKMVSAAVLQFLFLDHSLDPEVVLNDTALKTQLLSRESSKHLFEQHFQQLYTQTNSKEGYLGYLTFVYPIGAASAGPFDIPSERVSRLLPYGSMDSRWWSNRNNNDDVFAGLPFILITQDGVAFHGPISNYAPLDVWYLRRGYVSHGCLRMDSSDVMELRTLLPRKLSDFGKVKITILNHYDVTDWNQDGQEEVIDVKFYKIPVKVTVPKSKTIEEVTAVYKIQNQMKAFFKYHDYGKQFYDEKTDSIINAPKYLVQKGKLVVDGTHNSLPIARFDLRPTRIFQYDEASKYPLKDFEDIHGKYPPKYFLQY